MPDAPNVGGGFDAVDCPNEKGAAEVGAVAAAPKTPLKAAGFFCGDSIIVSPSDWEFVGPLVGAPNPPKPTLFGPLFPVLFPRSANGLEVVCGAKVKDPEGGAGAKLMVEGFDGGKEALAPKFDAAELLLLPNGVEKGLLPPLICPKRFGTVPLENDDEEEAVDEPPPWSRLLGALSLRRKSAFTCGAFILRAEKSRAHLEGTGCRRHIEKIFVRLAAHRIPASSIAGRVASMFFVHKINTSLTFSAPFALLWPFAGQNLEEPTSSLRRLW